MRKLLITAGVYESTTADMVQEVFSSYKISGLSHKDAITETMKELNLSTASVTSYLTYEKGVYFQAGTESNNLSVGAERVRRMRMRKSVLENLLAERSEETLWVGVIEFQGYKFRTYSGLVFSYSLKKGRGDTYTKELFIYRKIHNNVRIAADVTFYTHDVINSLFANMDGETYQTHGSCIEIYDNVFVGGHSVIVGNVSIGPNAIIGAGSVVTKNVPPGTIVAGNPAVKIGLFDSLHEKRKELEVGTSGWDSNLRADELWDMFYSKLKKRENCGIDV